MSCRTWALVLAATLLAAGCRAVPGVGGDGGRVTDGGGSDGGPTDGGPPGTTPITVGQWNVDWFGSTQYGPTDDDLQQQNVTAVLEGHPAPLWALEEVVDTSRLAGVAQSLGYDHLASKDSSVTGSADYRGTQQEALLYDPAVVTVRSAEVVLGSDSYDFAGRPPFVVAVDLHTKTGVVPVTVVVIHMKAYSDQSAYDRRVAASKELKAWLDQNHPKDDVIVLGDFNDDLDTSGYAGQPSPYANFVADTADYSFPTMLFTEHNIGTFVGSSNPIDHQMVTNELAPYLIDGSQMVIHPSIVHYKSTTSDHYPVQVSYKLP